MTQTPVPSMLWHYLHTGDGRGCFHRVVRWTSTHLHLVAACGASDGPTVKVSRTGLEELGEVRAKILPREGAAVRATMLVPPTVESDAAVPFVWHRIGAKPCLHRVRHEDATRYVIDRGCGCFEGGARGPGVSVARLEIGDSAAVKLREREWFYRPVVGAWAPVSEAPAYVPPRTRPPSQERHENATQARTDEEWLRSVREQVARAHAETYERVWRGALVRLDAEKHRAEDLHALDLDTMPATLDTLKAAWRTTARRHHPDAGGDASRFARSKAAYDRLTEALEKTP